MVPHSIPIPMPGGFDIELPRFVRVRQTFDDAHIEDVEGRIAEEFKKFAAVDLVGKRVAVGIGSRGIRPQPRVARAVIAELKAAGADVFVVPAMGSHGGGTAQGQQEILHNYGMTEEFLGAPIHASMDVVQVGELDNGCPVYCDQLAFEADYIVPCNRVKPHTDFRGQHESGLIKMLAIGMAKHTGAEVIHQQGFVNFHDVIPAAGKVFLENTKTLFGIAIVENAYDQLKHVELVPRDAFFERDGALLEIAKQNIPRFLFDSADVLVVDEIGKNISGAGMDPNATGRPSTGLPGFDAGPTLSQIVVRDLTEATHGNATGLGGADVTTQRVIRKMDWSMTYVNIVTSGAISGGKLPLVADTDQQAIAIALRGCARVEAADAKVVRVRNTLELAEIWMTETMLDQIEANPNMEVMGEPFEAQFDAEGTMLDFETDAALRLTA
jgi:hypothetical protein